MTYRHLIFSDTSQLTEAIAFTIVERENGLQHVKKMLEEGESNVKKTAISLIKNISRHQELHFTIGNFMLCIFPTLLPYILISFPFSSWSGPVAVRDGGDAAEWRQRHRPAEWGDDGSVTYPY